MEFLIINSQELYPDSPTGLDFLAGAEGMIILEQKNTQDSKEVKTSPSQDLGKIALHNLN